MKQQQESEGISQFIKPEKVHEDNAGQPDVGPARDPEDGAVDCLGVVGLAEDTQSHGDSADDETGVVEIETVHPGSVRQPAKQEPSHRVGDPDDGDKEGGLVPRDTPGLGSVLRAVLLTSTLYLLTINIDIVLINNLFVLNYAALF